jgi:hypothetical protein
METIKQIIYREEDGALMIIANNPDAPIIPRFVQDLTTEQKTVIENLRVFVLTKITDIKYVVYTAEGNTLNLESNQDENITLNVADLGDDKPIVDAVGLLCTQLLNS